MSLLDIEVAVYHPKNGRFPNEVLFTKVIPETYIAPEFTVEIPTGGSPVGDKRPLMVALRRVRGDTQYIGQSLLTLTFHKLDDVEDTGNVLDWTMHVHDLIGGDNDWHGHYLSHQESMELSRLHITWGPEWIPEPFDEGDDTPEAPTEGTTDHGELDGLEDNDHPQYYRKNGWGPEPESTVTLSFTDGTRTFEIAPTGADFTYWCAGVEYVKTTTQSVVITDTDGLWFIYFDGATLTASQTPWDIVADTQAFVAIVYWDSAAGAASIVGSELHGWAMDPATHARLHFAGGSAYGSGFAPGNIDTTGNGDLDSHAQMSIGSGTFYDEDILHSFSDGSPQDLSPIAQIPIFYHSGSGPTWKKIAATDFPITTTGSGRAAWNEDVAGTWQLTEISNNDFALTHIFATNDISEPIIAVVGQNEYSTRNAARQGALVELENLYTGDFNSLTPESIPICTLIFQTSNGYANAVKSRFQSTDDGSDFIDWRGTGRAGGGAASGITTHGDLSGLADDDHTQYHNDTRGDARYYTQSQVDTSLSGKSDTSHTHEGTTIDATAVTDGHVLTADGSGNAGWEAVPASGGSKAIAQYFAEAASNTNINSATTNNAITWNSTDFETDTATVAKHGSDSTIILFKADGKYKVTAHLGFGAAITRYNGKLKLNYDGSDLSVRGKSGYVRNTSSHTEASLDIPGFIIDVTHGGSDKELKVLVDREAAAGTMPLLDSSGGGESYLLIEEM